ncbi:MAG: DUF4149 domain-containing protein, partial [Acidobacteriaceae bacterium]|nr:DUF4149 domain-containing protein [Acidobacteriaceae bacterium]
APTVFKVLPTRHLAGAVVTRSLAMLHWMGLASGIVFAISSMAYAHWTRGVVEPFATRHLLVYIMLVLTVVSQFVVSPQMLGLRTQMVVIDDVPPTDARRVEFNRLHVWSTRLESAVLLLGLAALYLTVRKL